MAQLADPKQSKHPKLFDSGPATPPKEKRDGADRDNKGWICVRVAVPFPIKGTFSYAVPKGLGPEAKVGCRALVPFGNQKVTAYILERVPRDSRLDLKEISDVLDPDPLFHKALVPFFEWIADYYLHPIGLVIRSALPGGLNMNPFKTASLTEKGLNALGALSAHSQEKKLLSWIKEHPNKRLPKPLGEVHRLQRAGWVTIQDGIQPPPTGPLMRKFVRPAHGIDLESILAEKTGRFRAKNEVEFLNMVFSSKGILLSELSAGFKNGAYLADKWIKQGVLESYKGAVFRDPAGKVVFSSPMPLELNEHQRRALDHIQGCLDKKAFSACLLHGVTSSGKTEVYCRAIEHASSLGRQAILIVPEISLAIYMEGICRARLGDRIAIYHSRLSRGERYDQWMRIARGEVDLVIGARSALFAPFPKLGLIIVDEEHDPAYKQEGGPRYQARDAAVFRAKIEKVPVILGSGTPSVQSFQNSIKGKYQALLMPDRVESRPLPDVDIIDMKELEEKQPNKHRILSSRLRDAIHQNLKAGNQTILFLNRRGFHRLYICRSCGETIHCPNCDVALSYHLKEDRLTCHYCGFHSNTKIKCSSCGSGRLKAYGFGTEKLEHELKDLFPDIRIARMDTDSTQRKGRASQILKRFGNHEIDVLVGTQMITKGYDFPTVTLVGIIAADLSLGFPDFRAGERTFQLLSQVAGRAGRGVRKGRVIIQTFNPDHYAISTATTHDYNLFFEKEKKLRQQLSYPPFSHLALLKVGGSDKKRTAEAIHDLGLRAREIPARWPKRGEEIQVMGPVEAPIHRLKGKYRWHILIKCKDSSLLRHFLNEIYRRSKKVFQSRDVRLIIDVDPYQMI